MRDESGQFPNPVTEVLGHRSQPPAAIQTVNAVKEIEEHVLRLLDEIGEDGELAAAKRWLAIGRTQIEQGFMAIHRAVGKPARISIADEYEPIEEGFVIERGDSDPGAPLYFAPEGCHGALWSHDSEDALRLSREIDASKLAMTLAVECRVSACVWGAP